jgi:hypothetical protein
LGSRLFHVNGKNHTPPIHKALRQCWEERLAVLYIAIIRFKHLNNQLSFLGSGRLASLPETSPDNARGKSGDCLCGP